MKTSKYSLGLLLFLTICQMHIAWSQEQVYPIVAVSSITDLAYSLPDAAIEVIDESKKATGYWMYKARGQKVSSDKIVVFLHGYGGYNPMIYGHWIRHLVQQQYVVIFPRYQYNVFFPRPNKFAENAAEGIQAALNYLEEKEGIKPVDQAFYVGHSYGGTILSEYMIHFASFDVPKPTVALLCAPGTSKLSGGRLSSYALIDPTVKMVIIEEFNDWVVGKEFSRKVFQESPKEMQKALVVDIPQVLHDSYYQAHHNECYSVDLSFDSGLRNYTASRSLEVGEVNELDYNLYWRIFDLLCANNQQADQILFDSSTFQLCPELTSKLEALHIQHIID